MERLKSMVKKKQSYRMVLFIFIVVCLIAGAFSFQYYNHLQSAIQEESKGYLQEVSRRIGSNVTRVIDDNYAALNTIVSISDKYGISTFDEIIPFVDTQQKYWNCKDILLIDESGRAYNTAGKEVPLESDPYFDEAVLEKKQGISMTQMIDNEECILLMVPFGDKILDGKKIVSLAASFSPEAFEYILNMESFSGQAFSSIISKTGTLVVKSTSDNNLKLGYNVLATISKSDPEVMQSIEQVKKEINADHLGQIAFDQNGVRYYMVYTPVEPESWYLLTFVPAEVVNQKSDMLLKVTMLLCGVVAMAFAGLMAFLTYTFYRYKNRLEQIAYVDEITGGNTIQRFYELAEAALREADHTKYVLVYTNMQKFKVLNEQFGRSSCDTLLQTFHSVIDQNLRNRECVGRLFADNFCVLMEYTNEKELLQRFEQWYSDGEVYVNEKNPLWSLPITEFGVYIIDNDTIPFPQIIDRAKLSLRELPKSVSNKIRFAIYNDEVHEKLFREKHLEDMMEDALRKGEFQVYLQPKYTVSTKKIGGAEALTRWISETEGMIFPDEFIPLFEKNGFVIQLDLWIFEEVCKNLRKWMDAGISPVKISVNCSRVQLKDKDFLKAYHTIIKRYNIPPKYVEIELTESVVMEDAERLGKVIDEIHEMGFGCSMDDFGSGYSSLNLIQSIPVDTLKLDKIFFRENGKCSERMESVVGSIINMAQALSMDTVAEGVEYAEQVEMLSRIGCSYIQGYIFAKPMPVEAFEELAFGIKRNE